MNSIQLEDAILNMYAQRTRSELEPVLNTIKINIAEKYGAGSLSTQATDLAFKSASIFGGIYQTLQSKTNKFRDDSSKSDEFHRMYFCYVASEGTKQILQNGDETNLTEKINVQSINPTINFSRTDKITLVEAIENLNDAIIFSSNTKNLKNSVMNYFDNLSNYSNLNMQAKEYKELFDKYKNTTIENPNLNIDGINIITKESSKSKTQKEYDSRIKGLVNYIFEPVLKEQIVGNKKGIDLVNESINCLLHYDKREQKNIFKGFKQYIMFAGQPGTGKTMLAKYAMTLGNQIASNENLDLDIVRLDFRDRFQMGPGENLQKQFTQISTANKAHIVFMDEMDKLFPDNQESKDYMEDIMGELLRFRGESEYINKGNYILIGTTNKPKNLHKGVKDVFHTLEITGPETTQDRLKILYNNLEKGISKGYVKVSDDDWNIVADSFEINRLTGRQIYNVAKTAEEKFRTLSEQISRKISHNEKIREIDNAISTSNSKYSTTVNDLVNAINFEVKKSDISDKSYVA